MKIFIVPSWYAAEDKPLAGVFFREQAEALQARGHTVCVLYPDLRFRLGALQRGLYRVPGAAVPTYIDRRRTLTPFWEAGRAPQRRLMLERLYRKACAELGEPDLVHLHSCRMAPETAALCRRHGLPLVYTEHYSGILQKPGPALRRELCTALRAADTSIAVGEGLRQAMADAGGDAMCIPNMVDTECFAPRPAPHEGFVFAAMGGLVPVKGFDLLLRAFAAVAAGMPEAVLRIAGGGPEEQNLRTLAARLKLTDRVTFPGPVPRAAAPDFFNACDCFVCSSRMETFGMALIEALACGKPAVATRCGGPEGIVRGTDGLLCPSGDPEALARAMLALAHGRAAYDPAAIRRDCEARFGRDAVCRRLEAVYAACLRV